MRNNVIYNWGGNGCYGGEGMNVNIVNNYYKPGATTRKRSKTIQRRIACPGIRTVDYCLDKTLLAARFQQTTGITCNKNDVKGSAEDGRNYVTIKGTKYEMDMSGKLATITVNGTQINVPWNDWAKMLHVWGKYYVEGNHNPDWDVMRAFVDKWKDYEDRDDLPKALENQILEENPVNVDLFPELSIKG